ncbi:MAG: DUF86 domain-containing protein [Ignavibacteriae bacterium]|nr:DUF86 domain-containing protein [Ignavibacteriota bacterium]
MKREVHLFVKDISTAIRSIEEYMGNLSFDEFANDAKTCNAVVWQIQIIGEATKNIPSSIKKKYPDIPWKEMAGMRDRIVHSYFGISYDIVWKAVKERLPQIGTRINQILEDFDQGTLL